MPRRRQSLRPPEAFASFGPEFREFVMLDSVFVGIVAEMVANPDDAPKLRPLAHLVCQTIVSKAEVTDDMLDREIRSAAAFLRDGIENYEFWKEF